MFRVKSFSHQITLTSFVSFISIWELLGPLRESRIIFLSQSHIINLNSICYLYSPLPRELTYSQISRTSTEHLWEAVVLSTTMSSVIIWKSETKLNEHITRRCWNFSEYWCMLTTSCHFPQSHTRVSWARGRVSLLRKMLYFHFPFYWSGTGSRYLDHHRVGKAIASILWWF